MIADRRICVTSDRSRVVDETDPEAAFLLVGKGQTLSDVEARRYGLMPVSDPDLPFSPGAPVETVEQPPAGLSDAEREELSALAERSKATAQEATAEAEAAAAAIAKLTRRPVKA